jgi:hypothetical protein
MRLFKVPTYLDGTCYQRCFVHCHPHVAIFGPNPLLQLGIFVDRMIYCILQLISFVFAEQEGFIQLLQCLNKPEVWLHMRVQVRPKCDHWLNNNNQLLAHFLFSKQQEAHPEFNLLGEL